MIEILNLVNEKDEVIGEATRKEVNEKGLLYRCAGVYVFKEEKLVVQQRSKNKKIRPLNYSVVEETLKKGETYEQAALRGMKEELGVEAINLKPLAKKTIRDNEYPNYFIMQFFTARAKGELAFDRGEIEGIQLLSIDKVKELVRKSPGKVVPSLSETISLL